MPQSCACRPAKGGFGVGCVYCAMIDVPQLSEQRLCGIPRLRESCFCLPFLHGCCLRIRCLRSGCFHIPPRLRDCHCRLARLHVCCCRLACLLLPWPLLLLLLQLLLRVLRRPSRVLLLQHLQQLRQRPQAVGDAPHQSAGVLLRRWRLRLRDSPSSRRTACCTACHPA